MFGITPRTITKLFEEVFGPLFDYFYRFHLDRAGIATVLIIIILIILEVALLFVKNQKRRVFKRKRAVMTSVVEIQDLSVDHYRSLQKIDVFRIITAFFSLIVILFIYNSNIASVFALAISAFILVLKDYIVSFFAYFFILSEYKIGDDIKTMSYLGEIVSVKPLSVRISGKDEKGDYNGRYYVIPNNQLVTNVIERVHLKTLDPILHRVYIVYRRKESNIPFGIFLMKFKHFLNSYLPESPALNVGNFKSYTGFKYKLSYDYKGEDIVLELSFVCPRIEGDQKREDIIRHAESLYSYVPNSKSIV